MLPVLLTSIDPAEATPLGSDPVSAPLFADRSAGDQAPEQRPTTTATAATTVLPDDGLTEADRVTVSSKTSSPSPSHPASFVPDELDSSVAGTVESTSTTRIATAPALSSPGVTTSTRPATTTTRPSHENKAQESDDDERNHEVVRPKIRESERTSFESRDDGKD